MERAELIEDLAAVQMSKGEKMEQYRKRELKRLRRRDMDSVMSSLGLVKVRGAVSGRIYYE